ncbi:TIGR00269 family protein [Candidatus Woesearchaeota archaeon]|nr:TIGR00269 family protein [Candidatus Woesearchaeota archaeon]
MRCSKCNNKPVYLRPDLCKQHFIEYFEDKVKSTIKKFKLFEKKNKLIVATSGGKDSLTCLYLLTKLNYHAVALIIDEGIKGYREHTMSGLKRFCEKNKIKLTSVSFKKEFGFTLDRILKKTDQNACTVCGILRRYLLNKYSQKYEVIATGHNLDDEAQAILMNLLRNNMGLLARLGPATGISAKKKFTKRVKPLYFCSEKEVMIYTILKNIKPEFIECPYVTTSYRAKIRDILNNYEFKYPGTKTRTIGSFLGINKKLKKQYGQTKQNYCSICDQPSASKICNNCSLLKKIK